MGKLITVVGNSGVGKTTFVRQLCRGAGFILAEERLEERPFQETFSVDHHSHSLANQIDFLILRGEQEIDIRNADNTGLQDGGLDEDFYLFTNLFHRKGYLTDNEFDICSRTYRLLRELLPPPDLMIWLQAPVKVLAERFNKRDRRLEIATIEDLELMELLLDKWLNNQSSIPIIKIDSTVEDEGYPTSIKMVLEEINRLG